MAASLEYVTDVDDPRLGDYAALTDARLRKRYEHQLGVLIAEGPNPVRQLVSSPYPVRSVLVADRRLDAMQDVVAAVDAPVYVVSPSLLDELVRFRLHQGVLACGGRLPARSLASLLDGARLALVLEGLNDHENLGTLFRTARGFGADAVVLGPGCADPLYRRSVRVSMGHVLHVPTARGDDPVTIAAQCAQHGLVSVALTPDPAARDIRALPSVLGGRPVALWLGAEGPGLTSAARAAADVEVRIPMDAAVDSLNVAAAGAIALHAVRSASTPSYAARTTTEES